MKVTRLGRPVPILNLGYGATTQTPSDGTAGNVLTATGSNSSYWGENIARITANGSNANPLLGPYVNISAGSNVTFAWASNSLTINVIGSGIGGGVGGGVVLLEQRTASNSATLDFTTCITAAYDEYMIEILNLVPATTNVNLWMRMSTNGGSTYDTTGIYSYLSWRHIATSQAAGGATAQAQILLDTIDNLKNDANWGVNGSFRLFNPGSTSVFKRVSGIINMVNAASTREMAEVSGAYESATAVNAFRFLMSSGNIASGVIRVYGMTK